MLRLLIACKAGLTRLLEWVVIAAVAALVLDVLWGVASRYLLRSPSRWTEEAATMLLIWVSLLGAAVAFGRREHLGMDALVQRLDPAARRWMAAVAQLLCVIFAAAVMVAGGYVLVDETLAAGQLSPALGIKTGYVYLAVPLSGMFIVLFGLEQLVEIAAGRGGPGDGGEVSGGVDDAEVGGSG